MAIQSHPVSPLSKPALRVISINIEGFSRDKSEILSELCRSTQCDILCVQETHRDANQSRPYIPGLTLIAEICHPKHGNAVFVAPGISATSVEYSSDNGVEIITVDIGYCTVTSVYKPPNTPFQFVPPTNFNNDKTKIVMGDFNSHSTNWGYNATNADGEAVEEWAETQDLTLIHSIKEPASFNSGRWKRGYNPDLIFVSANVASQCTKTVSTPIPRTQHRPIMCGIQPVVRPIATPYRRRFNYRKANWEQYRNSIDDALLKIPPAPQNYDQFMDEVKIRSRKYIPRACRVLYIPGLSRESAALLREYETHYNCDPFSEDTIETGERLLTEVSEGRRSRWIDTVTNINMTHNSKKAWTTIRKLTNEAPPPMSPSQVTADQIAHQLLLNGKHPRRLSRVPKASQPTTPNDSISRPFLLGEITKVIRELKCGKASGVDNISVEQIKNLGPVAVSWLLQMFNECLITA
ncbi:uncharacterized protein LOC126372007 [Pectinophora gossypiella]|uniref:uncharacterized protein LOC126372007 n=1 Tax=Pectinophora gossypiella TaxID=13191 RepID=UPI00214F18EA|nr:uncharacterized protein LOC126372007 [Pectinophora gossypiella]